MKSMLRRVQISADHRSIDAQDATRRTDDVTAPRRRTGFADLITMGVLRENHVH